MVLVSGAVEGDRRRRAGRADRRPARARPLPRGAQHALRPARLRVGPRGRVRRGHRDPAGPAAPAHRHRPGAGRHDLGRLHRPALGPHDRRVGLDPAHRLALLPPVPAGTRVPGPLPHPLRVVGPRQRPGGGGPARAVRDRPRRAAGRHHLGHGAAPAHPRRAGGVPGPHAREPAGALLRPGGRRRRSGRPGRRRLRRLGGAQHAGRREVRRRRAGGVELADRELPRLPHGDLGRRPDAARPWSRPRSSALTSPRLAKRCHCARRPATSSSGSPTAPTSAARAVIVASGARYRRLAVDRLEEFEGNGVYYAATEMERRQCAASPTVVVGGGNRPGRRPCSCPIPAR